MQGRLISLTAPSGCGKTTLAGMLIERALDARLVPSYTTREERPSDLPGEYYYKTLRAFKRLRKNDRFLWQAEHGDTLYGTTDESIINVFRNAELGIMILVPAVVPLLRCYLRGLGMQDLYTPFFVDPPERSILEGRLRKRGDTEADIALRLDQATNWFVESKTSGIQYAHIRNDGAIETACDDLWETLHHQ